MVCQGYDYIIQGLGRRSPRTVLAYVVSIGCFYFMARSSLCRSRGWLGSCDTCVCVVCVRVAGFCNYIIRTLGFVVGE